jgi:hypothetical protein
MEPGVYISEENLGVRIEDDVLMTASGYKLLSERLPRDPDEIEKIMAPLPNSAPKNPRRATTESGMTRHTVPAFKPTYSGTSSNWTEVQEQD